MKVAMIGWEYPPLFSGGLGIHCQAIVSELTGLGVDVDFYLPTDGKTVFAVPDRMTMHQMEIPNSGSAYHGVTWEAVQKFREWLETSFRPEGVDIIHAHDWMGVTAAKRISEIYNIPLIWTVHSTEYDRAASNPAHPGIVAIEQDAVRTVKHIIAVSKRTKQCLIDRYHADPSSITVIYNGLDADPFVSMSERDYRQDDGYVLYLGRVTEQKGPGHFLEAARLVLAERNTRFMIAGDGDLLGILRRRARRWRIDDRVEFMGGVHGDQLLNCYRNAILYVLPAVSEPFGITVLEAMSAGLPTIISTATGAGEIVKHTVKVQPDNPQELARTILLLLDNPGLRETLGQNGASEAKHWTWTRVAHDVQLLYQKIVTDPQPYFQKGDISFGKR